MKKLSAFILSLFSLTVLSQSLELQQTRAVYKHLNAPISSYVFDIDTSKIKALGYKSLDSLNLYGNTKPTTIGRVIPNVKGKFYNFEYDGIFILQTPSNADLETLNTNPQQNLELYYTIRALEILKRRYGTLYAKLIQDVLYPSMELANTTHLNNWVNVFSKIVISFNTVSNDVAISGTYLDTAPTSITIGNRDGFLYENIAVVSIHPDLIKGTDPFKGAYPIYKLGTPEANYMQFLKEGLLHAVAHELIHRYIDINNTKKGSIYNYIAFGNGRANPYRSNYDKNLYNLEEAMLNQTLDVYFRTHGGLSAALLEYYYKVQTDNLNAIPNLEAYKATLLQYSGLNPDLSFKW